MHLIRVANALLLLALSASLIACGADSSDAVTTNDCEHLREHLVEVRMQTVTADHAQHRMALRASLDEAFISSCVEATSTEQMKCALSAKSGDELAACSESTSPPEPAIAGDSTAP
jgi:hypothetical protein